MKFNHQRGFGFVKVDGPFPEALIHIREFGSDVGAHQIGRGVRVEFYLENHAKGLRAVRVNII
jgi:cold shock CspA family protein